MVPESLKELICCYWLSTRGIAFDRPDIKDAAMRIVSIRSRPIAEHAVDVRMQENVIGKYMPIGVRPDDVFHGKRWPACAICLRRFPLKPGPFIQIYLERRVRRDVSPQTLSCRVIPLCHNGEELGVELFDKIQNVLTVV